jgi:hypothetical protein
LRAIGDALNVAGDNKGLLLLAAVSLNTHALICQLSGCSLEQLLGRPVTGALFSSFLPERANRTQDRLGRSNCRRGYAPLFGNLPA